MGTGAREAATRSVSSTAAPTAPGVRFIISVIASVLGPLDLSLRMLSLVALGSDGVESAALLRSSRAWAS